MKKIIVLLLISIISWNVYMKLQNEGSASANEQQEASNDSVPFTEHPPQKIENYQTAPLRNESMEGISSAKSFKCDGRIYCSQMTSCEEATYFLQNCPGVKMDGGQSNGIPCESQWCTN